VRWPDAGAFRGGSGKLRRQPPVVRRRDRQRAGGMREAREVMCFLTITQARSPRDAMTTPQATGDGVWAKIIPAA